MWLEPGADHMILEGSASYSKFHWLVLSCSWHDVLPHTVSEPTSCWWGWWASATVYAPATAMWTLFLVPLPDSHETMVWMSSAMVFSASVQDVRLLRWFSGTWRPNWPKVSIRRLNRKLTLQNYTGSSDDGRATEELHVLVSQCVQWPCGRTSVSPLPPPWTLVYASKSGLCRTHKQRCNAPSGACRRLSNFLPLR